MHQLLYKLNESNNMYLRRPPECLCCFASETTTIRHSMCPHSKVWMSIKVKKKKKETQIKSGSKFEHRPIEQPQKAICRMENLSASISVTALTYSEDTIHRFSIFAFCVRAACVCVCFISFLPNRSPLTSCERNLSDCRRTVAL